MEVRKNWLINITQIAFVFAILTGLTLLSTGCRTEATSNPARTATEQLLLSTAGDRAMATANLDIFNGKRVYVDFTYFDSYDSKYAEGEIRDALSRAGAYLETGTNNADIIVEARAGAYSVNSNSAFFGIPSVPLPIPGTAEEPVTPQVSFYQKLEQRSYAKIALLAYGNQTRAHIYSSGSLDGESYDIYRSILFISWWRSNIPEINTAKKKQQFVVWKPQYDLQNLSPAQLPPNPRPPPPPPRK